MINTSKLTSELQAVGIVTNGCNSDGIVWDKDNNEIQHRPDVEAVIAAHDPTPEPPPPYQEFTKPVKAPDFIVSTPKINADPEAALDEAIAEMEKGKGSEKSIALIALSLVKYLKSKKSKLK